MDRRLEGVRVDRTHQRVVHRTLPIAIALALSRL